MLSSSFIRLSVLIIILQIVINNTLSFLNELLFPYVFFVILLWIPYTYNIVLMMGIAFCIGFIFDMFNGTPGLTSSACLFLFFFKKRILTILFGVRSKNAFTANPDKATFGFWPYYIYLSLGSLTFFTYLAFLDYINHDNIFIFLSKIVFSTIFSVVTFFVFEMSFRSSTKKKYNKK